MYKGRGGFGLAQPALLIHLVDNANLLVFKELKGWASVWLRRGTSTGSSIASFAFTFFKFLCALHEKCSEETSPPSPRDGGQGRRAPTQAHRDGQEEK